MMQQLLFTNLEVKMEYDKQQNKKHSYISLIVLKKTL